MFGEDMRTLSPASFAVVMATAALSLAAHVQDMHLLARLLGGLNVALYLALWALVLWRVVRYPAAVGKDLQDHLKSPGFFTMVAGTCTLASQLLLQNDLGALAWGLLVLGTLLWLVFTYAVFGALTLKEEKPTLEHGLSGTWLLAVVATQSIAVISALLTPQLSGGQRLGLEFFSLSFWLAGGMMYIWLISLIFYRYTFLRLTPGELFPSYWINMGAMAISTLAGATLLLAGEGSGPFLTGLRPFIVGFTVLFWATGTWWIPLLVVLGVWRHVVRRFPLRYDVNYWGVIFPLAMYTLATSRLIEALGLEFLRAVPTVGLYVALGAWSVVFFGLVRALVTGGASGSDRPEALPRVR